MGDTMKRNGSGTQLMTLREVAGYLGLHVMTVYKLTREGRIPSAKVGGQWRFKRDVLDEWLEAQMRKRSTAKA
jgi:excisionase family DNA binding protein